MTRLELGEHGDALELVLEVLEHVGDVGTLGLGVEGDGAADLVICPVSLHEGGEVQLLVHGDVADGSHVLLEVDGDLHDGGGGLLAKGVLHSVASLDDGLEEGGGLGDSHSSDVVSALGEVHARSGASEEGHGAGGLDGGGLDGVGDAEPVAVDVIPVLDGLVALIEPDAELIEVVLGEELSDARDGTADSSVSQHDAVGLGPVGHSQGDGLGVQVGELERAEVLLEGVVAGGEGLHEAAELVGLEGLLQAGVAALDAGVLVVGRVAHSAVASHVVQPGETGLAVDHDALADLSVVHAELGENRVVAGPAKVGSLRVLLVVLEVEELLVLRLTEGDLGASSDVAGDDALADQVEDVDDDSGGHWLTSTAIEDLNDLGVHVHQGLGAAGQSAEGLELLSGGTDAGVIKVDSRKTIAIVAKVGLEQGAKGLDPALAGVVNDVIDGLGLVWSQDENGTGTLGIKADTDAEHAGVHEEGEGTGGVVLHVLRGDEGAIVQGGGEVLLVDDGGSHAPEATT